MAGEFWRTRPVVAVHDYSGHPFQVQLSRELARRGFRVTHLHCPSFSTPKGRLLRSPEDPDWFDVQPVRLRRPFAKYSGVKRFVQELEYGWRLGRRLRRLRPDVVLSSNTPLLAAGVLQLVLLASGMPVVFWQQDVYGVAMGNHARRRMRFGGRVALWLFVSVERFVVRSSVRVVTITKDFLDTLESWGVDRDSVDVVENWAPLDELPYDPCTENAWKEQHGLSGKRVILYSGTLGLKHNPALLSAIAEHFKDREDVRVVVASEGRGAEWLRAHAGHLPSLELVGFQPYDQLSEMMSAADVLVALLEPTASCFSVPSKVLTYHCAGRAILGALPEENLAARIITAEGSGMVVSSADARSIVMAAERLLSDDEMRMAMASNARRYAERAFNIQTIGATFEQILIEAAGKSGSEVVLFERPEAESADLDLAAGEAGHGVAVRSAG